MLGNDDLLVRLLRWAHRQGENYTTEAFTHVLEHLTDGHPEQAAKFLTWLTDTRVVFSADDVTEFEIRTQPRTDEHGIPDVRLTGPDVDVIVEVKLDGSLTAAQTDAYWAELEASSLQRRALVGLTGKPPDAQLGSDVVLRLWRDVGLQLGTIRDEIASTGSGSVITEREINQFLRLLGHLRLLAAPRVHSALGDAIEQHRLRATAEASEPTLFNTRVRRLDWFDEWPGLGPLRALLLQVRDAFADMGYRPRLESGQAGQWPWIGFTIDNLAHYVELNLDSPSQLTFIRYSGGVAPESFDGTLGRLATQHGLPRWCNDFDFSTSQFFEVDAQAQTELLKGFLQKSFAYSASLRQIGDEE